MYYIVRSDGKDNVTNDLFSMNNEFLFQINAVKLKFILAHTALPMRLTVLPL